VWHPTNHRSRKIVIGIPEASFESGDNENGRDDAFGSLLLRRLGVVVLQCSKHFDCLPSAGYQFVLTLPVES
jgi:hypothetical protein